MKKAKQVGSSAYVEMLAQSRLNAHQQLALIINQHLQAFIDQHSFLQLPPSDYSLATTLTPTSTFYVYFRDLVVAAYHQSQGLKVDKLGQKIHLFRSYLDRQNINFIRHYSSRLLPTNATDLQRLLQFAADYHLQVDLRTSAGFHNRYHRQFDYSHNMKVQLTRNSHRLWKNPARMIEFIVDIDHGSFVSQWNVLRYQGNGLVESDPAKYTIEQLYQVANTESFNYGIPVGGRIVVGKYRHTHQWLDISQPRNSKIRRTAKNYWRYPHDYGNGGQYADLVKNCADILAWRQVPTNLRLQVYTEYRQWLLIHGRHHNRGINYYLKRSPYRQFAIIASKKR